MITKIESGSALPVPLDSPLSGGASSPILPRTPKGQFPTGVSGNPKGRPPGSQNRASIVKRFIEEKLTDELEREAIAILRQAIRMAKNGDRPMIKLLLGDMLAEARKEGAEDTGSGSGKRGPIVVQVVVAKYGEKSPEIIDSVEIKNDAER